MPKDRYVTVSFKLEIEDVDVARRILGGLAERGVEVHDLKVTRIDPNTKPELKDDPKR